MKATGLVLVLICTICLLSAQSADERTDVINLVSQINADTLASHVLHLQNYQTRFALADNHQDIANWLMAQFVSYGFTNTYMQEYPHQGTTQYNVIATITGSVFPDTYIIVGGHYDSQSWDSNNYVYAPGADDNASGTAGVLEMARVMMALGFQPRCSIRFVAFSAEEGNAYGSYAYCAEAISQNQNIWLMVNMDMIASNLLNSTEYLVMPYEGSVEHCNEAIAISQQFTTLQPVRGWLNEGSDSYAFWQSGFDAVFFFERDFSPYWHSSEDIFAHLDMQYCAEIVRAATATTAVYANKPVAVPELRVFDTGEGTTLYTDWDASLDPSTDHYRLHYGTQEDSLDLWQDAIDHQCLISGLAEGQTYYLAVCSVNATGNESFRTHGTGLPLSIPRAPQALEIYPLNSSITVSWAPNAELDLQGYNVYRALGADGVGSVIGTVTAPQTSYVDTEVSSSEAYYYYRVCALDNLGQQSPFSTPVTGRLVSLDRGILVIDESKNFGGTSPFQPTDEAVDDFYQDLLEDFAPVHHLDLEETPGLLRLSDLGVYSSILWHGNDNADLCYPYEIRAALQQYILLGGNVLFTLYQPSKAFELSAGYPGLFPADSFINEVLGIAEADYSVAARFKYALPNMAEYAPIQVDSLKAPAAWQGHIFGVEATQPVNPSESVFTYGSDYAATSPQGALNGRSVGVLHSYGAGQAFTLSFPLYNMQAPAAKAFADYVFSSVFHESNEAPQNPVPGIPGLAMLPNYPNPFSSNTAFQVQTKDLRKLMQVNIYNLKGQLVRRLYNGYPTDSKQLAWDGRNDAGMPAGSGVYFIRVKQDGKTASRKILLLK